MATSWVQLLIRIMTKTTEWCEVMSYSSGLAEAKKLKSIMNKHGVKCSIELVPSTRGSYNKITKRGVLSHHTASYRRQGATPFLSMVKKGRTGVPGPLSNGYGGRDLVYRILTMGKANHAGRGGPYRFNSLVPANHGNTYLWGTEYEGGYESWSDSEREFMGRANAALLEYHGFGLSGHGEHKTWAGRRKIDRLNYTTGSGRAEIDKWDGRPGSVKPSAPAGPAAPKPTNVFLGKSGREKHAAGSRNIRFGDTGTDVALIQRIIGATDDGFFGSNTVTKSRAWQGAHNLKSDAIIGPLSWSKAIGQLVLDGLFREKSISELQRVMHTPVDGKYSNTSTVVKAVQHFLNHAVGNTDMKKVSGVVNLSVTGKWNRGTIKALQFYLFNEYAELVFGRSARSSDYDGINGPETSTLFQYAVGHATRGSKRF